MAAQTDSSTNVDAKKTVGDAKTDEKKEEEEEYVDDDDFMPILDDASSVSNVD